MADDVTQLQALAITLRQATGDALTRHSWFAQTLDDCRLDVERLLAAPGGDGARALALAARAELVLRTWQQVLATIQAGGSRWHCACGGVLVDVARPGRVVPFRGREIEIPASFVIPTCDRCAAERLDPESAHALDAILLSSFMSLSERAR